MPRTPKAPVQPCSVARAAGLLADPWVIVILRDAFRGARRFDDFHVLSGAAKTVVSDRLGHLVAAGLMARRPYSERPPRDEYRLTAAGRDLFPVIMELMAWGDRHLVEDAGTPVLLWHRPCGAPTPPGALCGACGERLTPETIRAAPGPGAVGPEAERVMQRLALIHRRDR